MRKFILLAIFVNIIASAAFSQTMVLTPADSMSIDTTVNFSNTDIELPFQVKNTTNTRQIISWKRVGSSLPLNWTLQLCDPYLCYASANFITGNTLTYSLDSQATGIMRLGINPNCHTNGGIFRIAMWVRNDSANTLTYFTWKVNVVSQNCFGVGISEVDASQISLYPNPVKNELKLTLPAVLDNGQIDIYNLIGSKVYSQPVTGREKAIDLSSLETGIYITRISENGKVIATRKFTKTE